MLTYSKRVAIFALSVAMGATDEKGERKMKLAVTEVEKDKVAKELAATLGGADLVNALCGECDGSQVYPTDYAPKTLWLDHGRECLVAMWRGVLLRAARAAMQQGLTQRGQRYQQRTAAVVAAIRDGTL